MKGNTSDNLNAVCVAGSADSRDTLASFCLVLQMSWSVPVLPPKTLTVRPR